MTRPRPVASIAGALLVLAAAACAAQGPGARADRLQVVATTTVIADFVRNVGGDQVDVRALVPPGGEPHTFDPSPSDVTSLESAVVVFANGLGLDEWLGELVTDAGTSAPVVELAEDLEGVRYREAGVHHEGGGGTAADDHGSIDPHVWLNAAYARLYVDRIADELAAADADGAAAYRANADAYRAELDALHAYAGATLGAIPEANRSVVSFHEAFGYFAEAYGLVVVDTVLDAPGQDPSAGEVAALIDEIRARQVRAILAESQFPTDLVDRIAEETGATVVSDLFSDSLGEGQTYLEGLRSDVEAIAAALR